jgi:hypothetical protein
MKGNKGIQIILEKVQGKSKPAKAKKWFN